MLTGASHPHGYVSELGCPGSAQDYQSLCPWQRHKHRNCVVSVLWALSHTHTLFGRISATQSTRLSSVGLCFICHVNAFGQLDALSVIHSSTWLTDHSLALHCVCHHLGVPPVECDVRQIRHTDEDSEPRSLTSHGPRLPDHSCLIPRAHSSSISRAQEQSLRPGRLWITAARTTPTPTRTIHLSSAFPHSLSAHVRRARESNRARHKRLGRA